MVTNHNRRGTARPTIRLHSRPYDSVAFVGSIALHRTAQGACAQFHRMSGHITFTGTLRADTTNVTAELPTTYSQHTHTDKNILVSNCSNSLQRRQECLVNTKNALLFAAGPLGRTYAATNHRDASSPVVVVVRRCCRRHRRRRLCVRADAKTED